MRFSTNDIPPGHAYLSTNGGFAPPTHFYLNFPERFLQLNYAVQKPLPICIVQGGEALARELAEKWLRGFMDPPPLHPEVVSYL